MSLIPEILKALKEKNYTQPTPIQQEAIPQVLSGKDVLATAQTGTGKTAAFAIPIIQKVVQAKKEQHSGIKALILSPTRELAIQIEENINAYAKHTKVTHKVIFGGVKQHGQVQALKRGVDILVATPGRLLDLHGQGLLDISTIQYFVLDEADRMLDMGFINDIKRIIKIIPEQRQTLFFSATLAGKIKELSRSILTNPVNIAVDPPSSTAEKVSQHLYYTNKDTKKELLKHVIEKWAIDQAIVFTRTKHGADRLAKVMKKFGYPSGALHGGKAQNNRQKTLQDFKAGKIQFLIATDIAARGIDIDKLGYVINYEIPNESEAYVHRIGRSGRAGEDGVAISFSEPEENEYVRDIEKLMGQKIAVEQENPFPQTEKPMTEAEKKQWRKEKEERKRAFFEARRNSKNSGGKGGQKKKDKKQKPTNSSPNNNKPQRHHKKKESDGGTESTEQQSSRRSKSSSWKSSSWYKKTESKSLKDKYMWPLG